MNLPCTFGLCLEDFQNSELKKTKFNNELVAKIFAVANLKTTLISKVL